MIELPFSDLGYTQNYFGLDQNLIKAIITVESGGNKFAMRYEPNYKWLFFPRETASRRGTDYATEECLQKFSYGPMQIIGAVARQYGFEGDFAELCSWDLGMFYGCKHLKRLSERFANEADLIASYNAGTPRKTDGGMYENQLYLDKVYAVLNELRKLK